MQLASYEMKGVGCEALVWPRPKERRDVGIRIKARYLLLAYGQRPLAECTGIHPSVAVVTRAANEARQLPEVARNRPFAFLQSISMVRLGICLRNQVEILRVG